VSLSPLKILSSPRGRGKLCIWCSQAAINIVPGVSYPSWAIGFAALSTFLNTGGIHTSSRVNAFMAIAMSLVVLLFLGGGVHYILTVVHPTRGDLLWSI